MTAATPGQAAHQAETVAIAFHQAYEELAPQYGYRTREASAKSWDEMPAKNAALMVATAARLLETGMISVAAQEPRAVTDMLGVAVQALRRITEGGTGCDPQTVAGSALGIIDRGIPGELRWDLIPVPEPEPQPAPELAALQAERDCYRFALAQIAAAAEVAPDASRAGLGRIADGALAENSKPMAAKEPHAAPDSNHEPGLSECGCRDCDPRRHGTAPASDPRVVPLDAAVVHEELHRLIKGIETLAADLTASAAATRPSRESQIEDKCAIALRKLLEDE